MCIGGNRTAATNSSPPAQYLESAAQPGAHLNGIHEVAGSIPASSTNPDNKLA